MAHVLALYNPPVDPAAFDRYYFETHVPLAKQLPGLRSYTTTSGTIAGAAGSSPYYLIAFLEFDSMAAIQSAMSSAIAADVTADVGKFATGGVTILMYDTKTV